MKRDDNAPDYDEVDDDLTSLDEPDLSRDRDGVAALNDVEAEAGDEGALADLLSIDIVEARELGADLDEAVDEPRLD